MSLRTSARGLDRRKGTAGGRSGECLEMRLECLVGERMERSGVVADETTLGVVGGTIGLDGIGEPVPEAKGLIGVVVVGVGREAGRVRDAPFKETARADLLLFWPGSLASGDEAGPARAVARNGDSTAVRRAGADAGPPRRAAFAGLDGNPGVAVMLDDATRDSTGASRCA